MLFDGILLLAYWITWRRRWTFLQSSFPIFLKVQFVFMTNFVSIYINICAMHTFVTFLDWTFYPYYYIYFSCIGPKEKYLFTSSITLNPLVIENVLLRKVLAQEVEFYEWLKFRLLNRSLHNGWIVPWKWLDYSKIELRHNFIIITPKKQIWTFRAI